MSAKACDTQLFIMKRIRSMNRNLNEFVIEISMVKWRKLKCLSEDITKSAIFRPKSLTYKEARETSRHNDFSLSSTSFMRRVSVIQFAEKYRILIIKNFFLARFISFIFRNNRETFKAFQTPDRRNRHKNKNCRKPLTFIMRAGGERMKTFLSVCRAA